MNQHRVKTIEHARSAPTLSRVLFAALIFFAPVAIASQACDEEYLLRDLDVQSLQIANQDVSQLMYLLLTLGYETVAIPSENDEYEPDEAKRYSCDKLPVVVMPPQLDDARLGFDSSDFLGLAGSSSKAEEEYDEETGEYFTPPDVGGDISPALHNITKPHSGEVDHLLVFYHPDHVNQFYELKKLVTRYLDQPATQIYIEGMVLEVSEEGIDELGIRYERTDPDSNRQIGLGALGASAVSAGGAGVIDLVRDTFLDSTTASERALFQLQALVSNGSAEVLSRPSVLTLSNRQATIQIIDVVQFPIQEATITSSGDIVQSAFQFEAVRPGITLNLRPRVSAERKFISMEIDVTVEALVSANNGEVRSDSGQVIATKPGSSARRVQTFARIPDRTPIIIGGLISTDRETIRNRVPGLSRLPFMGKLFGATSKAVGKREVIIVLTPYIVREDKSHADVSVPKDTSLFDVSDMTLFQDSYRLRAEDVFDLQFLLGSPRFQKHRAIAEQLQSENPTAAMKDPYQSFLNGRVPGGDKFLNRMIYDLVKRRDFGKEINYEHLIAIEQKSEGSTDVRLLKNLIHEVDQDNSKAVFLVFGSDDKNQNAEVYVSSLDASSTWEEQLWALSYGSESEQQFAVILRNQKDFEALVDATVSAAIVDRNGGYEKLTVTDFQSGTLFSIPSFDTDRFYVVDKKVARVFTDAQNYYRAMTNDLESAYAEMNR